MLLNNIGSDFVGRGNEIRTVAQISTYAKEGSAHSIFISGRRGIGKTEFLTRLFQFLFLNQRDAVPVFFSMRSSGMTIKNFSLNYLSTFILHYLAFLSKDQSISVSGVYSLNELKDMADRSSAGWAVELIEEYRALRDEGEENKLFAFVISLAYQSYVRTGVPVVMIIDDFHRLRRLGSESKESDIDIWVTCEDYLRSLHTPHVVSGFDADLQKMFFQETSIGEHLDIYHLSGLNRDDSYRLFSDLCGKYDLKFDSSAVECIDIFKGNPFYIKSFVQAARRKGAELDSDAFWRIYVSEVTGGKIFTYWTSLLRTYIADFEKRRPSLNFLGYLFERPSDITVSEISRSLSVEKVELEDIIEQLYYSGAIEMGFSTLDLADDQVLADVVIALYQKEIKRETADVVREMIVGSRIQPQEVKSSSTFDVKIPSEPKTELVAVRSLEQVARHYGVPAESAGELQVALIELFAGFLSERQIPRGDSYLRFARQEDLFIVEIEIQGTFLDAESFETDQLLKIMRSQIDDMKVEKTSRGTKIIMIKKIKNISMSVQ